MLAMKSERNTGQFIFHKELYIEFKHPGIQLSYIVTPKSAPNEGTNKKVLTNMSLQLFHTWVHKKRHNKAKYRYNLTINQSGHLMHKDV